MNDFRKRILEPLLFPLAAFAFVGGFAWGLSRLLLITTKNAASGLALIAALSVLVACGVIAGRSLRKLELGAIAFGFVALVAGGSVLAATLGVRPIEAHLPEPSAEIVATNKISFETDTIQVEPADTIVIRFLNQDVDTPEGHNWGAKTAKDFLADGSETVVDPGPAFPGGQSRDYVLEGVDPGAYFYFCFVHPNMTGTLIIGDGEAPAPPPGPPPGPPGPPGPAAETVTVVAENIAFDRQQIDLPANAVVGVTLENRDNQVPHNIAFYTPGFAEPLEGAVMELFPGVATRSFTFTSPEPGEYPFRCDVHPQQMTGVARFG